MIQVQGFIIQLSFDSRAVLWGYRCEENRCVKFKLTSDNNSTALGLSSCRLFCNKDEIGTLWPKPNGNVQVTREVSKLNPKQIKFKTASFKKNSEFWKMATERFLTMQDKKIPKRFSLEKGGSQLLVDVIADTDEMSELKI